MIIEVNSLTDPNNSHIYKDILDVGESIDESFLLFINLTMKLIDFLITNIIGKN